MENVSSVGYGSALAPEVQAQYAVKCIKMAQQTAHVAGNLIQDTVEISQEALEKCLSEK